MQRFVLARAGADPALSRSAVLQASERIDAIRPIPRSTVHG